MRGTVLVIHNQAGLEELLKDILAPLDFQICDDAGGLDLEELLNRQHVSLVFLGLEQGKPDLEVLRQIRELDSQSKVVVFTTHTNLQMARQAMGLGAQEYIHSPFDRDLVRDVLDDNLCVV